MALYSYVIDHDFGFAPNPFFGACTLATCKPQIRERASSGDHVMGTGCAKRGRSGRFVYMMRIDEIIEYDDYWADERFKKKRPTLHRGIAHGFGDNIYHRDADGSWQQANSLHTFPDGSPNPYNREHDTHSRKVLIGREFVYFGGDGPLVPAEFRDWKGDDVCGKRGYRRHFAAGLAEAVIEWGMGLGSGLKGTPADWTRLDQIKA
ncbi:hypothetical protein [uncultured Croceicoccus sp.]|uniref:Nmad2 family putative nucleotide modification protein n=1 Tax=uncultured Croceicoccus sp. TaxID=1295329 RepID=UPI0026224A7D|nr:hypothetical protein [uncultured Croceicoccus sp.]